MLSLSRVEASYGSSQVLFGVSLDVRDGEVVTLLGRNGMGKTTTVSAIMGLVPVHRGTIIFLGQAIGSWPTHRIARAGLALVPEGRQVFPNLSFWKTSSQPRQIGLALRDPGVSTLYLSCFPRSTRCEAAARACCREESSKCWPSAAPS
jgi:branched-chain amino acid transport system ATP-binding protein